MEAHRPRANRIAGALRVALGLGLVACTSGGGNGQGTDGGATTGCGASSCVAGMICCVANCSGMLACSAGCPDLVCAADDGGVVTRGDGAAAPITCGSATCGSGLMCCNAGCNGEKSCEATCPALKCAPVSDAAVVDPCARAGGTCFCSGTLRPGYVETTIACPQPPPGTGACGASCYLPAADAGADAGAGTPCSDKASSCPANQVCDYNQPGRCVASTAGGTCIVKPTSCPQPPPGDPAVCGCDGTTYLSDCLRQLAGAQLDHVGACGAAPAPIDCSGGKACPQGYRCACYSVGAAMICNCGRPCASGTECTDPGQNVCCAANQNNPGLCTSGGCACGFCK